MKMQCSLIILAGVTVSVSLPHSSPTRVTQETEPPLSIRVSGLGQERVVSSGDSFEVTLGGETRTLTVESLPNRRLCTPEVCFEYPAHFGFEYDPSEGSRTWTLDGNDATIIVQVNPSTSTTRSFAESMAAGLEQMGGGTAEWIEGDSLEIEGFRFESLHYVVPWTDMELRIDVHGLLRGKRSQRASTFLIVQEVAELEAADSLEIEEVREQLAASLTRPD